MSAEIITQSLEAIAERCGDPTPLVYERLFAENPEIKPLFVLDHDNAVKGNMLAQVLECFMDYAGDRHYAANLIACEKINHENIGIPPETFSTFFETVVATFRDILKEDWSEEYETTWTDLITDLDGAIRKLN
ncbi:MAG: globin [Parvibaculaceae bacterium]